VDDLLFSLDFQRRCFRCGSQKKGGGFWMVVGPKGEQPAPSFRRGLKIRVCGKCAAAVPPDELVEQIGLFVAARERIVKVEPNDAGGARMPDEAEKHAQS